MRLSVLQRHNCQPPISIQLRVNTYAAILMVWSSYIQRYAFLQPRSWLRQQTLRFPERDRAFVNAHRIPSVPVSAIALCMHDQSAGIQRKRSPAFEADADEAPFPNSPENHVNPANVC